MRRRFAIGAFACAMALGAWSAEAADTIQLTGASLSYYLGDPGGADLVGDGFEVGTTLYEGGGWPISIKPGDVVNFSTVVGLSY